MWGRILVRRICDLPNESSAVRITFSLVSSRLAMGSRSGPWKSWSLRSQVPSHGDLGASAA